LDPNLPYNLPDPTCDGEGVLLLAWVWVDDLTVTKEDVWDKGGGCVYFSVCLGYDLMGLKICENY